MNWTNILTIYGKELRDMLRDRRTMISMIVVPTVAMPGLFALVIAVSLNVQREVAATLPSVMILGGDDSPVTRDGLLRYSNVAIAPVQEDWRQQIADKKLRAAVELPPGLDAALARGESVTINIYNYEGEMRSDRAVRARKFRSPCASAVAPR